MRSDRDSTVLYLYGITKAPAGKPPGVRGVDNAAAIEPIACGGLVCWISRVPAGEFAENLSRNLENLDWLAAVSVRHQRAVAAIAAGDDILPARLGTVFVSESSLKKDIQGRNQVLHADLERIRGTEEWSVRVFRRAPAVQLPQKPRSGAEYLKAKSSLMRRRQFQGPDDEVKRLAAELEKFGPTVEGGRISAGRRDLQYHITMLLKRCDRKKFQGLLRRFSREWKDTRSIECSGPWPPYSFVSQPAGQTSEVAGSRG